ncbi:hypothetical protein SAMN05880574_101128 [Chryseobacterium sp. RU37D]|nr:hypothetical protein SAMN05880574_101128 [Chryseobacterium sp. RU37D]
MLKMIWYIKEKQHKVNEQILIPNIDACNIRLIISFQRFFKKYFNKFFIEFFILLKSINCLLNNHE